MSQADEILMRDTIIHEAVDYLSRNPAPEHIDPVAHNELALACERATQHADDGEFAQRVYDENRSTIHTEVAARHNS